MNKKILSSLTIAMCCITWVQADEQMTPRPRGNSIFYYKLGGGQNISLPPSLDVTVIPFSARGAINTSFGCGNFDIKTTLSNSINRIKDGIDSAYVQMQEAATSAIVALPGYLLQKANPGLYDMFNNGILRAEESFRLATKSCERMRYEMQNGIDPYEKWVTMSVGERWKYSIGSGGNSTADVTDVRKRVDKDRGDNGVKWIGGKPAGGKDQPPINVVKDIAKAGFNMLHKLPVESESVIPTGDRSTSATKYWKSSVEVADWAEHVLGEVRVTTCDNCQKGSRPGNGLLKTAEKKRIIAKDKLVQFMSGELDPTPRNLETISAPGVAISYHLITALNNLSADDKPYVISKLADEIAQAQTIDQALSLRRILLAGRREGNVQSNELAIEESQRVIDELDQNIENLLFEDRVRKELVSGTAEHVLNLDFHRKRESLGIRRQGARYPNKLSRDFEFRTEDNSEE
ncbi:integrating conjugative element protein [Endozoicomonas sp. SM1973]|uniref:Integrating conjugative element protein n=1 Tax=Spartinivicinus marinus TaxID=2994442 RepID=A0A853IF79_9GAMM|nr:integrating conjugative element protein [Spartinivicinus marinus]MCX4030172.1 integrating conjugative element protein [Spartinivicinus marinus]NYZ67815.1 integrating conjugative element protein [Spartinivicinus marinus]